MNLPGHKYTGPGNKLRSGKPIDHDDKVSQFHDELYYEATSKEDISNADTNAIVQYLFDHSENLDSNLIHNIISASGLGIKHLSEKVLGHSLYPFNLPGNYVY